MRKTKKRKILRGNNEKHGAYKDLVRIDGRSRAGKVLRSVEAALIHSLGNDPSPQEILLVRRAATKAVKCALSEVPIVEGVASETLEKSYLRWSRELRMDLLALGLERRLKNVTNLNEYLEANYGQD